MCGLGGGGPRVYLELSFLFILWMFSRLPMSRVSMSYMWSFLGWIKYMSFTKPTLPPRPPPPTLLFNPQTYLVLFLSLLLFSPMLYSHLSPLL